MYFLTSIRSVLLPLTCEVSQSGLGTRLGQIQELLGHKDVSATMIYTHVLNKGGHGVRSPVDEL